MELRVPLVLARSRLSLSRLHVILLIENIGSVLAEHSAGDFRLFRAHIDAKFSLRLVSCGRGRLKLFCGGSEPVLRPSETKFRLSRCDRGSHFHCANDLSLLVGSGTRQILFSREVSRVVSV